MKTRRVWKTTVRATLALLQIYKQFCLYCKHINVETQKSNVAALGGNVQILFWCMYDASQNVRCYSCSATQYWHIFEVLWGCNYITLLLSPQTCRFGLDLWKRSLLLVEPVIQEFVRRKERSIMQPRLLCTNIPNFPEQALCNRLFFYKNELWVSAGTSQIVVV